MMTRTLLTLLLFLGCYSHGQSDEPFETILDYKVNYELPQEDNGSITIQLFLDTEKASIYSTDQVCIDAVVSFINDLREPSDPLHPDAKNYNNIDETTIQAFLIDLENGRIFLNQGMNDGTHSSLEIDVSKFAGNNNSDQGLQIKVQALDETYSYQDKTFPMYSFGPASLPNEALTLAVDDSTDFELSMVFDGLVKAAAPNNEWKIDPLPKGILLLLKDEDGIMAKLRSMEKVSKTVTIDNEFNIEE